MNEKSESVLSDQSSREKQQHTMKSLFVNGQVLWMEEEMIRTSFYLPKDIYNNPRYSIQTVVLSRPEFMKYIETHEVYYCENPVLVNSARTVGVSVRVDLERNLRYRLAKVWWGAAK